MLAVSLVLGAAMTGVWAYSAPWFFTVSPEGVGGLDLQFLLVVALSLGGSLFVVGVALAVLSRWYLHLLDRL